MSETTWEQAAQHALTGAFGDLQAMLPLDQLLRGPLERIVVAADHVAFSLRWVAYRPGIGPGFTWKFQGAPRIRVECNGQPRYDCNGVLRFYPRERTRYDEIAIYPRFDVRAALVRERKGPWTLFPGDVEGALSDDQLRWSCARLCGLAPDASWQTIAAEAASLRQQGYLNSAEEFYMEQRAKRAA